MKAIFAMDDIAEEDTHHLHALTMTIGAWTRDLFSVCGDDILYLKEKREDGILGLAIREERLEERLERQMSFLPDWIAFQHLSLLLEWSMADTVQVSTWLESSALGAYALQCDQVVHLLERIFGPSDERDYFIDQLLSLPGKYETDHRK